MPIQSNPCSMSDVFLICGPPEDEITSAGTDDISNRTRPNDISQQHRHLHTYLRHRTYETTESWQPSNAIISLMATTYLPTYPSPPYPPPHLPNCIPTFLPTYPPPHLHIYLPAYPPTHLPTSLIAYLHTYLPTHLPPHRHTYLPSYPPSYRCT